MYLILSLSLTHDNMFHLGPDRWLLLRSRWTSPPPSASSQSTSGSGIATGGVVAASLASAKRISTHSSQNVVNVDQIVECLMNPGKPKLPHPVPLSEMVCSQCVCVCVYKYVCLCALNQLTFYTKAYRYRLYVAITKRINGPAGPPCMYVCIY